MGGKPTEIPEGSKEALKSERARANREVNLLPSEEKKVDDLGMDPLELKVG